MRLTTRGVERCTRRATGALGTCLERASGMSRVSRAVRRPMDRSAAARSPRASFHGALHWGRRTHAALLALACGVLSAILSAATARACPDCSIGRAARADVWSHDFGANLAIALAPFVVMVLVSAWAERLGTSTPIARGPHEQE